MWMNLSSPHEIFGIFPVSSMDAETMAQCLLSVSRGTGISKESVVTVVLNSCFSSCELVRCQQITTVGLPTDYHCGKPKRLNAEIKRKLSSVVNAQQVQNHWPKSLLLVQNPQRYFASGNWLCSCGNG
jgi:hypothetical protein